MVGCLFFIYFLLLIGIYLNSGFRIVHVEFLSFRVLHVSFCPVSQMGFIRMDGKYKLLVLYCKIVFIIIYTLLRY